MPLSKKQQERRKARRATYDLPPEVKQLVVDIAEENNIPISHAAAVLLVCGADNLRQGRVNLTHYLKPDPTPLRDGLIVDMKTFLKDWG